MINAANKMIILCLLTLGLLMEGIYRVGPPLHVLNSLKEAFDTDPSSVNPNDLKWDHIAFSGALKLFLRDLPNPIIPYDLYDQFIAAASKL